ncbi:group III truncated hemoglobin [Antarcticimicrobium sediminis]|uniref:Group III truncated hemoglobin n=1 Tax=Antarcticimicrobium sediminis TaxID=2546227 RepID=A0A4V2Z7V9_9RHOB|nr:group III truncated hemoglobin [Antarcticimicrobium sediminis]TDE37926.1 group III truncated hemoglobin [Antarcticimicrobium sediminis]
MSDRFNPEQAVPDRKCGQLKQAVEIIGIDRAYLSRMLDFFVARIRADKQLCRVFEGKTTQDRRAQVERMRAFWLDVAVHDGGSTEKLVAVHRNLPGLRREDFDRWLELFRATLEETAPTPEAANYLVTRAERIAQRLKAALFENTAADTARLGDRLRRD